MRLPLFLIAILVSIHGLSATSRAAEPPADKPVEKPNVLVIIIDDLNDWVGCMDGHPDAKTPHIDKLAKRGMLFANAHCQAPICGPSRGSFLSGRYPHSTGLYQQPSGKLQQEKAFDGTLLPQYFAKHGYDTFGVGKVTHGMPLDVAVQTAGSSGSSGPKPEGPKPPNDVRFNFTPDYSVPFTGTQTDWAAFPERDEQMPDVATADWAVKQLRKAQKKNAKAEAETPWMMMVGFHRPHVPFYVPQKWFDLFPLADLTLPVIKDDDLADVPATGVAVHDLPRYPKLPFLRANNNEQLAKCTQAYLACTAFVDAQVGKVLDALEDDNTVVVLFSDHGYHIGEKDRVSKHSLWEESTRVPMMISHHKLAKGVSAVPVGLIDVYPTLVEFCDLPGNETLEGVSLVPLLASNEGSIKRDAILTTYGRGNHSVRTASHRYIRYADGAEELYDLKADPFEWKNLAGEQSTKAFKAWLPKKEAPYLKRTKSGPVNAWFEVHLGENGIR